MFGYDFERREYNDESDFCYEEDYLSAGQTKELQGIVEDLIDYFYCKDRDLKEVSYYIQRVAEMTSVYLDPKLLEDFEV